MSSYSGKMLDQMLTRIQSKKEKFEIRYILSHFDEKSRSDKALYNLIETGFWFWQNG